ncbi:nucleotide exchange factor GrpE [Paracoccaceae bacterium GXU_MW_L88]
MQDDDKNMDVPEFDEEFDSPLDDEAPDPIDALTAERDELKDRLLRSLADQENLRKRFQKERQDAENFGGTRLARDLLPVHDNLARAIDAIDPKLAEQAKGLVEGIELVQKELLAAFSKHKIERLTPEVGDKFDPQLHEAMFEAPVPNMEPGHIIQVTDSGFTIAGRLLRPAKVGVAAKQG